MLLHLHYGRLVLLRDLITIEVMADPAVFEFGEQDLSARVLAMLAIADGGAVSLARLAARAHRLCRLEEKEFRAVLAALRWDGPLPAIAPEWNLLWLRSQAAFRSPDR